ncbi:methyltransferase domain-containing protein [Nocardia yunnanensis]|uniref:Methyltransferase domain-containing protein n=1 Tax=Nocardia yunnanensis TaxID=2382165 RepID=A0A386ZGZ4_9NOCA|nr:methyltransferase domain-containing protein [Nocardia yunnanensis]AYF76787.1 methyltransferase domain-containing protein [Nocardia yunnanensis]
MTDGSTLADHRADDPADTLPALRRASALLDPARCRQSPAEVDGYLDVLGAAPPAAQGFGQRLMRTRFYAGVYQLGRPVGLRLASLLEAPGRDADRARTAARLGLRPGATVLDIACGPGNFTGWFGTRVGPDGLAVGVDASRTMLARAVADNSGPSVAYLHGDAEQLPFADEVADAVSCLAALYLINEPFQAIGEMWRVLKPGGRIVILTSLGPGGQRGRAHVTTMEKLSSVRMFGRDDITGCLRECGFTEIDQVEAGIAQTVTATKPHRATP